MKHGDIHEIVVLDELGSTVKESNSVYDFKAGQKFRRYEIKVRVHDKAQELQEYLNFQKSSEGKLDPVFVIKPAKPGQDGYYHIVKCWTEKVEL